MNINLIVQELKEIEEHENYFKGKRKDKETGELYDYVGIKLIAPIEEENDEESEEEIDINEDIDENIVETSPNILEDDETDINMIERVIFNEETNEKKISTLDKIKYLKSKGWEIQNEIKISNKFKSIIFYKKI